MSIAYGLFMYQSLTLLPICGLALIGVKTAGKAT